MTASSRTASAWLFLAGTSILAALVRVLTVYHAPLPRWDLIACFAVAALGVIGCLVTVRRGDFSGLGSPPPHRWWPDLRSANMGWGLAAWLLTLAAVGFSMTAYSSDAGRIVAEGHTLKQVGVEKVVSSKRPWGRNGAGNYEVEVRVLLPFDGGRERVTAGFKSPRQVQDGDQVWALYAPSAPDAGALLDSSRSDLEEKLGSPFGGSGGLTLVLLSYVLWLVSAGRLTGNWLRSPLATALRLGRVRSCTVRAAGGTAATVRAPATGSDNDPGSLPKDGKSGQGVLRPCLELMTGDGTALKVAVDPSVDAVALATALSGSALTLYWHRKPVAGTVASGGGAQGSATLDGALVVNGDRALPCWVIPDEADGLPEGTAVPAAETPPPWARLPQMSRFPQWSPSLHTGALVALLLTCVLLGVIALGTGVVWTIVLAVVACFLPILAKALPAGHRLEQLEALVPTQGQNT